MWCQICSFPIFFIPSFHFNPIITVNPLFPYIPNHSYHLVPYFSIPSHIISPSFPLSISLVKNPQNPKLLQNSSGCPLFQGFSNPQRENYHLARLHCSHCSIFTTVPSLWHTFGNRRQIHQIVVFHLIQVKHSLDIDFQHHGDRHR